MHPRIITVALAAAAIASGASAQDRPQPPADPSGAPPTAMPPSPAEPGPPPATLVESAAPVLVASGFQFTEGPLWREGRLLFSDIPADAIYALKPGDEPVRREAAEVFRKPSGNANGNTLDAKGRLITAQHDGKVTRTEADGTVTILASAFEGKRLNSPNDVVVHSSGAVYFTDPPFGATRDQRELDFCGVYRLVPGEGPGGEHALTLVTKDLQLPNGLAFSPDETRLYVNDHRRAQVHVFDVTPAGGLTNGRVFAELRSPPARGAADGLKVDSKGNIYTTGPGGVWVISPAGEKLGRIGVQGPTNVCFGGEDARTLFITAGQRVYSVRLATPGTLPGPRPAPAKPAEAPGSGG